MLTGTRWLTAIATAMAAMLLAAAVAATTNAAAAGFGIVPGTFQATTLDSLGNDMTQAGAHPDATVAFQLTTRVNHSGFTVPTESLKDVRVDLPPGALGNPKATARCSVADFSAAFCPPDTQVGVVRIDANLAANIPVATALLPVYNLAPAGGNVAQFGFRFFRNNILITAKVRSESDYGITAIINDIPGGAAVYGTSLTLWGVPSDSSHDALRFRRGAQQPGDINGDPFSSTAVPAGFYINPTLCGPPVTTTIAVRSWENPGQWVGDADTSDSGPTGCDALRFEPSIAFAPDATRPGAPSGYRVDLRAKQNDPLGLAVAALKRAVVRLPAGVVVSPSSADGLAGCTVEQIGLKSTGPAMCPDASKIGTAEIESPVLEEPLEGSIYLAQPTAQRLLGIYIVAEGNGVTVKLDGTVDADPVTGQLTTTFDDNPQMPVSRVSLGFVGGARAALANPRGCGTFTSASDLTSWSSVVPVVAKAGFDLSAAAEAPCTPGFAPQFSVGSRSAAAGADSALLTRFGRNDSDEILKRMSMQLPKGLLARVSGVTQCAEAAANAGSCGADSRIGSVVTATGPGPLPLQLGGGVYLTGPYGGGPFGLSIVVPAKAGPFDLGLVVVRAAVLLDAKTAQLTVVSDPLPTILKGIPLQIRTVDVRVDRDRFVVNPTNCSASAVNGSIEPVSGAPAAVSSRFRVGGCGALALKPQLGLTLSGKGQARDGGHPAIRATVTQPQGGQANLKKVRVTLPLSLALDPDNSDSDALCSFAEGSKPDPKCPASSVVGKATAVSPILNQPLSGPVYFVKNERKDPKSGRSIKTTPKLVIPLVGENGLKLTLTGTSDVIDDRLVTTFDDIPDAQVSSFRMDINGGKKGILVVSDADICKSTQIAGQQITGQNNGSADADVFIQTPSCPLKVLSKNVGTTSVVLRVSGLGAGKVTVTGKGIKKTTKTISKSTVAIITAKRSKGKPGKVTVSFDPAGPAKARKASK